MFIPVYLGNLAPRYEPSVTLFRVTRRVKHGEVKNESANELKSRILENESTAESGIDV